MHGLGERFVLNDDGFVQEAQYQHFARAVEADAARAQVEQRFFVHFAGGGAVRALDVVGVDFQARHAVRARAVGEEDVAAVLARVGFLCAVGDVDHAVEDAERRVVERAAHALVAFAVFGEVAHVQVVVAGLFAREQLYAAEGEVCAFAVQFAVDVQPQQVAAYLQGVDAYPAVGGLLYGGLCHLCGAGVAMKPQGNVYLCAVFGVHRDDG